MRGLYYTLKGEFIRFKLKAVSYLVVILICCSIILAADNRTASNSPQVPPIETFCLKPIELENISIWVPADRVGPVINRACIPKNGCSYLSGLPASVHHIKSETCPDKVARLLAEYTACYHQQNLPLTIFNGWQWECSYNVSQFESFKYDLPRRGGSWENSQEAVLTQSTGSADFLWVRISTANNFPDKPDNGMRQSSIEVKRFSSIRTRDGYPKKRQL